jgi:hypothetical protein
VDIGVALGEEVVEVSAGKIVPSEGLYASGEFE